MSNYSYADTAHVRTLERRALKCLQAGKEAVREIFVGCWLRHHMNNHISVRK